MPKLDTTEDIAKPVQQDIVEVKIQSNEKAVQLYQQAADLGYLPAMYSLAVMYEQGTGIEKDVAIDFMDNQQ